MSLAFKIFLISVVLVIVNLILVRILAAGMNSLEKIAVVYNDKYPARVLFFAFCLIVSFIVAVASFIVGIVQL